MNMDTMSASKGLDKTEATVTYLFVSVTTTL